MVYMSDLPKMAPVEENEWQLQYNYTVSKHAPAKEKETKLTQSQQPQFTFRPNYYCGT